jgi:uncharacterized Zn finger protein
MSGKRDEGTGAPKLPAPRDGVRVRKLGRTWWGRRWLGLLERAGEAPAPELDSGRALARQGRVRELRVEDGIALAEVVAEQRWRVELRLVPFVGTEWERVAQVLVQQAGFEAALLAGQLPDELASRLEAAGLGLFPLAEAELSSNCTCPVWSERCEHVLAVALVLAAALDGDPLLLFELRGRGRAELLGDLTRRRAGTAGAPAEAAAAGDPATLTAEAWAGMDESGFRTADPALEGLAFHFEAAAEPLAVLRRLGPPPDVDERLWLERLGPAYVRAVARALELALEQPPGPA